MISWMRELAKHHNRMRRKYPEDRLLIVIDIDGSIIDTRFTIVHLLREFDRLHRTAYFTALKPAALKAPERELERILGELEVPKNRQRKVLDWFHNNHWTSPAMKGRQCPTRGALEVIRWFQLQPNTAVGLNTARPESLRHDTLESLNELGREFRARFESPLLQMNPGDGNRGAGEAKVAGVKRYLNDGYRVIAVIDSDPENLRAIAESVSQQDILLLHAKMLSQARRTVVPRGLVSGRSFDLTELISEEALPPAIQLVWHGINTEENLRGFLRSDIHWAEIDVREDPGSRELVLRHDDFAEAKRRRGEGLYRFEDGLRRLRKHKRCVKIDFKEGGAVIGSVLDLVAKCGFEPGELWFNGNIERVQEAGFRQIGSAFPSSIRQCPVDFLSPLFGSKPAKAKEIIEELKDWGINRVSVGWHTGCRRQMLEHLDQWNIEVNIYDVPDLEAFLQAVLLMPRSITSDFNFPEWDYHGTGSGENRRSRARRIRTYA